jgi:hypothetical protein
MMREVELLKRPLTGMSPAEATAELEPVYSTAPDDAQAMKDARLAPFVPEAKRPAGRPKKGYVQPPENTKDLAAIIRSKGAAKVFPALLGARAPMLRVERMNLKKKCNEIELDLAIGRANAYLHLSHDEWPSIAAIAKHIHVHPRTVKRHLDEQRRKGWKLNRPEK